MKMYKILTLALVVPCFAACGGGSTPEAQTPEQPAASAEKPKEGPKAEEGDKAGGEEAAPAGDKKEGGEAAPAGDEKKGDDK